ncbi:MAG: aspartyl protease family protein [Candidatus Obscuribacterales bacterium]|nr:aspartyl protease family protein [Candidatus Obscuribacterales bacterium]
MILVLISLLPLVPFAALGQEEESAELTVSEIVDKAFTAYGGKEALEQIDYLSVVNGKQISIVGGNRTELGYRCARKNGKWRIDLERLPEKAPETSSEASAEDVKKAAGSESAESENGAKPADAKPADVKQAQPSEVYGFDGHNGWRLFGKEASALAGDELDALTEKVCRHPGLLTYWQEPDTELKLVGRTLYKQLPVYTLTLIAKGRTPTTFYVDEKNFLVVAIAYDIGGDGVKSVHYTTEYSQYRPCGGTLFPFKQIQLKDQVKESELILTSASVGQPIEDSLFDRPKQTGRFRLSRSLTVPFEYADNEIVVKCRVNNSEDVDFLFDTGASDTIIDRRIAAQNFLAKQDKFDIAGYSGMVQANRSELKRFEIGSLVLNDVPVRVLDMSAQSRQMGRQIAGIIGTNIISQFLVTIDYSKPNLVFEDMETAVRPIKAANVPFIVRQLPYIKVSLNGRDEQLLLVDTGAAFNHLPTGVAQRHVQGDPAAVRHVTEATGLDGRPVQLGRVVVDSVVLGGLSRRGVPFTYPIQQEKRLTPKKPTPEGKERAGFFQDSNFGILGNPFWENFIVTVDYRFQRLLLQLNPVYKLRNDMDDALSRGDTMLVARRDYRQAEVFYQKALLLADGARDVKMQARLLGRLGNLRRIMAKDLNRPEHAKAAYQYFVRAQELAKKVGARDVEGRILADWSLLYSDNGQKAIAKQAIDRALVLAPQDANVNVDCAVHLYRAKLFPEMQRYVEKALFLEPSNWSALWYQVKLSENFQDLPRVVATLKEILRFYPWSKVAQEKLATVKASMNLPTVTPAKDEPVQQVQPTQQVNPGTNPWLPRIPSITPSPPGREVPTITPWGQGGRTQPTVPIIVPMNRPMGAGSAGAGKQVPMIVPTNSKEKVR